MSLGLLVILRPSFLPQEPLAQRIAALKLMKANLKRQQKENAKRLKAEMRRIKKIKRSAAQLSSSDLLMLASEVHARERRQ